jgi:quercetin dioxygenase-like cupin family protein
MELELKVEERAWDIVRHIRHIDEGPWKSLIGPDGKVLPGISGKIGVSGPKGDGTRIGADFIKMDPGARFQLHTHVGDHEIFFISGEGFVHVDGRDNPVRAGHLVHIPGEYAHGVWVADGAKEPLIFTAAGHPHRHVHAVDRMEYVRKGE